MTLEYKGYVGAVEYDPDEKLLHGRVTDLQDVVTFQAKDAEGLERAFRESVDEYLAFCAERGEAPDKPYSGRMLIRADSELHRKAARRAAAAGVSLSAWVAEQIRLA